MPGWIRDDNPTVSYADASYEISETLSNFSYYKVAGTTLLLFNNEIHMLGGYEFNPPIPPTINPARSHYKWDGSAWVSVSELPFNFYGPAVVLNGEIHIFGYGGYHYKWDGISWTSVSVNPYGSNGFMSDAVVLNGEIHVLGGINNASPYGGRFHYKWDGTNWSSVSTLPYDFYDGHAVVLNDEIHILGGYNGLTNHYKWNGSSWTSVSTLPFSPGEALVLNDEIHIFDTSYYYGSRHYKWNGSSWTSVSALPSIPYDSVRNFCVLNNHIHLLCTEQRTIGTVVIYYTTFYACYNGNWLTSYQETISSAIPYNFEEACAVTYNGEIHILGSSDSGNRRKHYKWTGYGWDNVSSLPHDFYNGSAVVYNNEIHILGGSGGNGTKHYKWNGFSWSNVGTLPFNFYNGSAVVYNNEIHILGGGANPTSHYKWNGTSWSRVSTIPYNFERGCVVVYDNEIHILGSYDYETRHYRWNGTDWVSVSTLPFSAYSGSAIVYNDKIHLLGSRVPGARTKHSVWNGSSWTSVTDIPYNFYYGGATIFDSKIALLGSLDYSTRFYGYSETYTYNKIKDTWVKVTESNVTTLIHEETCTGTFQYSIPEGLYEGQKFFIEFEGSGYGSGEVDYYSWRPDPSDPEVIIEEVEEYIWEEGHVPSYIYQSGENTIKNGNVYITINLWGSGTSNVKVYIGTQNSFTYKMKNILRAWIGNALGKASLVLNRKPFASQVTDSNPDDVNIYIQTGSYRNSRNYIFTFNDKLYGVARGSQNILYSFNNGSWSNDGTIANLPVNYDYGQFADVNGVLHYLTSNGAHYIYDSSNSSWIAKSSVPNASSTHIVAASLNGILYAVVGGTGTYRGYFYRWNANENSWVELPRSPFYKDEGDQPTANVRSLPYRNVLLPCRGKLYLIYFNSLSTTVSILYAIYDPLTNTWGSEKSIESDITGANTALYYDIKAYNVRDYLILFGVDCDYIYDVENDKWDKITSADAYFDESVCGRSKWCCASVLDGELHIVRYTYSSGSFVDPCIHEKLTLKFPT